MKLNGSAVVLRAPRWLPLVFIVFVGSVVLFSVSACASRVEPIYNVANDPVPAAAQKLPLKGIERAITDAALSYRWRVEPTGPDHLKATYVRGSHEAVISIRYSQISYSITLVSSVDLLQHDGEIHRNYNRWIHNLEKSIEDRLLAASSART
jgi:hypothetical protein